MKESSEKPKFKSNNGIFQNRRSGSRNVQDEVDEARRVLEKEEPTYKVLSKASFDILKGTVGRPINEKLEEIQKKYEAKKEELFGEIIADSKKIDSSIKNAIEKEMHGISKFEYRVEKKIKSEDLDDSTGFRNIRMYGKTFFGSVSARMAKTPYTFMARYYALKGDERKQDELLFKASKASRKVIERLRSKNRKFAKETEARVDKFNEVDDATTHYREREAKLDKANTSTQDYIKENTKDNDLRKKVTLRLANIGKNRMFAASYVAEFIEDKGNAIARASARSGHFKIADFAAQATVKASDYIMDKAAGKNTESYMKTDSIVQGIENAKAASNRGMKEIAISEFKSKSVANMWAKHRGNSLKAKGINLVNRAVTSTAKFFATNDMKISDFYARAISNLGLPEKSQEVMEKAAQRTKNTMDKAEGINKGIRENFGFSIKRRKNVENTRSFMEILKKGITRAPLKDSKGEFSTWIEDIENKRSQQKVKRKFKATGKKIGVIDLLERGSKSVFTRVQATLSDTREARAAAQVDLDMNPEKQDKKEKITRKSFSREDRE